MNIFESGWGTPLCAASSGGKVENAKLLLQQGADVNGRNQGRSTALCIASYLGHIEVVDLLLKNRAELELEDGGGHTALGQAAEKDHRDVARLLLSASADVNHKSAHGWTPVHIAIQHGNREMVQILLRNGGDIESEGPMGLLPLHRAIANKDLPMAQFLLENGAQLNASSWSLPPPVFTAILNKDANLTRLLLSKGAETTQDISGMTVFHEAARVGLSAVQMLIEFFLQQQPGRVVELVNQSNKQGQTPLHWAAQRGDLETVRALTQAGACIELQDEHQRTPLQLAEFHGKMGVKDFLLSRGAKNTSRFITFEVMFEDGRIVDFGTVVGSDEVYTQMSDKEYESELKDMLEEKFHSPIKHVKLAGPQTDDFS